MANQYFIPFLQIFSTLVIVLGVASFRLCEERQRRSNLILALLRSTRHCEERSDEAISLFALLCSIGIASSPFSKTHRNDDEKVRELSSTRHCEKRSDEAISLFALLRSIGIVSSPFSKTHRNDDEKGKANAHRNDGGEGKTNAHCNDDKKLSNYTYCSHAFVLFHFNGEFYRFFFQGYGYSLFSHIKP